MAGHLAPGGAYKYFARGKTLTRVKSWRKGEFTSPAQVKSMGSPPGEAGWGVPPAQGMDEGHGAEVVLGSGIDEVKVFWQFHHIHDMGDLFRFAEGCRFSHRQARYFLLHQSCHAAPAHDARLPSDSDWSAGRCAALRSSSLRSIRAVRDGSALL